MGADRSARCAAFPFSLSALLGALALVVAVLGPTPAAAQVLTCDHCPAIMEFSASPVSADAGTPVFFNLRTDVPTSFVEISYSNDTGQGWRPNWQLSTPTTTPSREQYMPLSLRGQTLRLQYVRVWSAASPGASTYYYRDGRVVLYPSSPAGTHGLDLPQFDVAIGDSGVRPQGPNLIDFELARPKVPEVGDRLDLTVTSSKPLYGVEVAATDGADHGLGFRWRTGTSNYGSGNYGDTTVVTQSTYIPAYVDRTTMRLTSITLIAADGSSTTFERDGSVSELSPSDAAGPNFHHLDFSTADFTIGAPAPPPMPAAPAALALDGQANVSWSPSASNVGPVIGYTVTSVPDGKTCSTSGARACTVEGLTNGTPYAFTLTATNALGASAPSATSSPVTPAGVPAKPDAPAVTVGDSYAYVTWDAPPNNGDPITGYTVTSVPEGNTCTTTGATWCTVYGLTSGTAYTFTVKATNVAGASPLSEPSNALVPSGVPRIPPAPTAVGGDGTATVAWSNADPNGSPITQYTVTASPGGGACTTTALTCTLSGLTNDVTYTFTVVAINLHGESAPSASSNAVTPTASRSGSPPSSPLIDSAWAAARDASVSWTLAPDSPTPSMFVATAQPGGLSCSVVDASARSCVIDGLTPGVEYTLTVKAANEFGVSEPSEASSPVVPRRMPLQPDRPIAIPRDSAVQISWTKPKDFAEAPIVGYEINGVVGNYAYSVERQFVAGADTTTVTVPGFANGQQARLTVTPVTEYGNGPASITSWPVTPQAATPPDRVAAPSAEYDGTRVWVWWQRVNNTSGNYVVTAHPGGSTKTVPGTSRSAAIEGLTNGVDYTFTVRATNADGAADDSEPSNAVTPADAPDRPAAPTAVRGDGQADVSWAATGGNGSAVTGYTVTASPGAATCATTGALSCTVDGLTNGTTYTFTVVATNAVGDSPISEPSTEVTPAGVPNRPAAPTVIRGDGQALVSWAATGGNGSVVTNYTVTASPGGETCATTGTTSCTVGGLINGTSYAFTVMATNAVGDSPVSEPSNEVTPAGVPFRPVAPTAVPGDGQALVSWAATGGNGSAVTGYTVTASPGGKTCAPTGALSCTVAGLTNGTSYTFTTVATNAVGDSPSSEPSNAVTPAAVPDRPAAPTAVRGDAQVLVSWPGTGGNGSAVKGYTVTANPGGKTCTTTGALSCTVDGLTNGTGYTFTLMATNAVGDSPVSEPSSAVTPAAVPDRPAAPTAVRGDAQVLVSWPGTGGNGSAVTGYTVTANPGGKTCATTGALSCTVDGLVNGTPYTFTVVATNAVGGSPVSDPSNVVTPAGVPSRPVAPTAVPGDGQAVVAWAATSGNGSAVTNYTVTASPGGKTCTTTGALSCLVGGLTNGISYSFTVVATNAVGTSPVSEPSNALTPQTVTTTPPTPTPTPTPVLPPPPLPTPTSVPAATAPSKMKAPKVLVRGAKVIVRWSAPNPNGSAITRYRIDINKGKDKTARPSATKLRLKGLKPGRYRIRIAAKNAIGVAPYSNWVTFRIR